MWKYIFTLALVGGLNVRPAEAQEKSSDLAIIVNKNSALDNVTMEDLTKIFRAEKTKDSAGVRFIVTARETGSAERAAVLATIYKMSEEEYAKYFLQATFVGLVQSAPRQLSGAATARQFVAVTPGALGGLRASDVDDSVKVLKVNGRAPGEPDYPLKLK